MSQRRLRAAAALVVAAMALLALLAACARSSDPTTLGLEGSWRLTRGTVDGTAIDVPGGRMITLVVSDGHVSGIAACNQYAGSLTTSDGGVKIGTLQMTEMACDAPVMAAEAAYTGALGRVTAAARAGNALTLSGDGVSLQFLVVPQAADVPLVGTTWELDTLLAGEVASSVTGAPATLILAPDGTISGSTGCRTFAGRYTLAASGERVSVSGLLTDARACQPDLEPQDAHVLAVLRGGFAAKVDGQVLILSGQGGQGLAYRAAAPGSTDVPD